jgi:hypothetical protein
LSAWNIIKIRPLILPTAARIKQIWLRPVILLKRNLLPIPTAAHSLLLFQFAIKFYLRNSVSADVILLSHTPTRPSMASIDVGIKRGFGHRGGDGGTQKKYIGKVESPEKTIRDTTS